MTLIIKSLKFALKRFGRSVKITRKDGTKTETRAMIEPLLYKNKLYVELQPSEVGVVDDGCCRYIGPAEVLFSADDRVEVSCKSFTVQRFELFYLGDEPQYAWAILRPCTVVR